MFPHSDDDVQYLFPDAVGFSEKAVKHAMGMGGEEGDSVNPMILISEEMVASGEMTVQVRRAMSRRIRELEIEVERRARQFGQDPRCHPHAIWELFVDRQMKDLPDGAGWASVTTDQVLDILTEDGPKDWVDRFTVHQTLMNRPELFQAQAANMRLHARFAVRPREDHHALTQVIQWIREHQVNSRLKSGTGERESVAGPIDAFIQDSKHNIDIRRRKLKEVEKATGSTWPDATLVDLPNYISPSPSSKLILSCLFTRMLEQRATQISPYLAIAAYILKACALYADDTLNEAIVHRFLTEAGYIDAWDSFHAKRTLAAEKRNASTIIMPASGRIEASGDGLDDIRHDFGELPVYVIDDATAVELDDGLSVEDGPRPNTTWVHVHVADPTHWIRPTDPVALRAQVRVATLYLPGQTIPLLDRADVLGRMSLGALRKTGSAQHVMTFSTLLDSEGHILGHDVRAGLVRNVKVASYNDVDRALGCKKKAGLSVSLKTGEIVPMQDGTDAPSAGSPSDVQAWRRLSELSTRVAWRRRKSAGLEGYLAWASASPAQLPYATSRVASQQGLGYPEVHLCLPNQNAQASQAQGLVTECMILAGRVAGTFCRDQRISVPYRGGPAPFVPKQALRPGESANEFLQGLLAKRDPETLLVSPLDLVPVGLYFGAGLASSQPLDHWMLGITAAQGGYTRVTSPLRRYGDLLAHWQIKARLSGADVTAFTDAQIRSLVVLVDERDKRIRNLSKSMERYWVCQFLQLASSRSRQIGPINLDDMEAIVITSARYSLNRRGTIAQVYLPELGVLASWNEAINIKAAPQERIRCRLAKVVVWPAPGVDIERVS